MKIERDKIRQGRGIEQPMRAYIGKCKADPESLPIFTFNLLSTLSNEA